MLSSRRQSRKRSPPRKRPVWHWIALAGAFLVFAGAGAASGVLLAYTADLPEISALDDYHPSTITTLLAIDGTVIEDYATERRVVVDYDDIAPALRDAIVAVEDAGFYEHGGLSVSRIAITIVKDLLTGRRAGASTLTQQLARDLFLRNYRTNGIFEVSAERKIREWIVATQIERRYTKREIFAFYANQIYFGHGAYGVEAAARLYFRTTAKQLTVEEAATLAAIIQIPNRLSPYVNITRATERRNYVLQRMAEEGYLTEEEANRFRDTPIVLRGQPGREQSLAPYFSEEVRKMLERQYGAKALYEAGLTVQTTLDSGLQAIANAAVDKTLRRIDKRRNGYRGAARNLLDEELVPNDFSLVRWSQPLLEGDIVPAVVEEVVESGRDAGTARVRIGAYHLSLLPRGFAWTRRTSASRLVEVGDLIEVRISTTSDDGLPTAVTLEQPPTVEGALLAIDNRTGQIRAMVGGFSFARSKFNRATQARRQMGSVFKPFLYTAAIETGFTAASTFIDEPISYPTGPDQPPYEPLNYDQTYKGHVTLRYSLEHSRNIPAVKAMVETGPERVVEYAKRFGFPDTLQPFLSLALGAAEATLVEVTSAYSTFPNRGVRMLPYSVMNVVDREGNTLEERRPEPREAVRADTAFIITSLLQGVVQRGTGTAALALDWPLGGKTGTMDEYTDAWFVGFDPNITVGVWVGHDEKKPLGKGETGAAAALPIWMDFMRGYIDTHADRSDPPVFEAPGSIVFATLPSGITEAFISGTQPADVVEISQINP
jgi:penicillin-binding protein 1A